MDLEQIEQREHDKYSALHKEGYGAGTYEIRVGGFVKSLISKSHKVLELGCGQGNVIKQLASEGYNIQGTDITLDGVVGDKKLFTEAPLWNLPFDSDGFDFSYSTDVMEHIPPELVGRCIDEIFRVTTAKTLHIICPRPSTHKEGLHLTIQTARWWRTQFSLRNKKKVQMIVMDSEEFSVFSLLENWRSEHDD